MPSRPAEYGRASDALGGRADPANVAPAIAFFLSSGITRTTGQTLVVDGGGEPLMCHEDIWAGATR